MSENEEALLGEANNEMLFWGDSQSAHDFLKGVFWHSLYCIDLVMKRGLFYFIFLLVA